METLSHIESSKVLSGEMVVVEEVANPPRNQGSVRVSGTHQIRFEGLSDLEKLTPLVAATKELEDAHPQVSITKVIFKESQDTMVLFLKVGAASKNLITKNWSRDDTASRLVKQLSYLIQSPVGKNPAR